MTEHQTLLVGLSAIVVIGVLAQWAAWRLRMPAILLLLLFGIVAGPVSQLAFGHKLLDPDRLFGHLLFPLVSLSVAIILFEGGLTLKFSNLRQVGTVFWRLVTLGAVTTGAIATLAAIWILGLSWQIGLLVGAILVVTGPTVIGPMLRFIRPTGPTGGILKWEGIVIDPVGATLALLVFEAIAAGPIAEAWRGVVMGVVKTIVFGGGVGLAAAVLLVTVFRRLWIADHLQAPLTLMVVLAAFTGANVLQEEAGLLAVTVLGIALANQNLVSFRHVLEFKENLTILLVSSLFVLLAANLDVRQVVQLGWRGAAFVLVLVLVARPLSVWVSTMGSALPWRDRIFLAAVAPRGIVAAAVASLFALRLAETGVADADQLVPAVFASILATVTIYGLGAPRLAKRLGLANRGTAGFLVAGAGRLAREIAAVLRSAGHDVLLVDTNRENIAAARLAGLPTLQANILSPQVLERIDGTSIGRLLALTPNDEVNSLATVHFARQFGRSEVYQLPEKVTETAPRRTQRKAASDELRGRMLFDASLDYHAIEGLVNRGATVRKTQITREYSFEQFQARSQGKSWPMFLLTSDGQVQVDTVQRPITAKAGQTIVSLTLPDSATSLPVPATDAPPGAASPSASG